jgi:NodT family efflux transporter outer membrane factor (OMF) lipoprotein
MLALLLSGCVMGPEYDSPPAPPGATGRLTFVPTSVVEKRAPDAWWSLFDDSSLDALVEQALAANTDLRAAEANLDAARASFRVVRSTRLPATTETVGASYGRSVSQSQIANALGRKAEDGWLEADGFQLAYEIDLFGRVRRSEEAARADTGAVEADRDAVRLMVASETVRAYMTVCSIARQIGVTVASIEVARQQNAITRSRFDAGGATAYDVASTNTLLARARATLPILEGDRRAASFALSALLGRTPGDVPDEVKACRAPSELRQPVPVGDAGSLLQRRPDIRLAERRLAAATARIGVAQADLYPRISFMGSLTTAAPEIAGLGSRPATSFGLGPLISWSFPNLNAARARVAAARAQDRAALANYDGAVLTALKEVEQTLARYGAAIDREVELDAATASARREFELASKRFAAGSTSRLELTLSEQKLLDARTAGAAAATQRLDLTISLFKALGGGWEQSR